MLGLTRGAAAPSASAAHGDVGRCTSLQIARTPSITPERTAGAGSPITAMYAAVITSVAMLAVAGPTPPHRHGREHRASRPAHLRAHVGARCRRVLELRAPLRATRRFGAASRALRGAPECDARASREERAECRVRCTALEARDRGVREA